MLYGKWSEFTSFNQKQCYFVRVFVFIHGRLGVSGSFAIVREYDDESLIKSRPQCSELPDLPQAQNENSIHFFFFMNICYLSLYYYSYKTCLEDIATVCAQLISKASNNSGCDCSVVQGHSLEMCQKPSLLLLE